MGLEGQVEEAEKTEEFEEEEMEERCVYEYARVARGKILIPQVMDHYGIDGRKAVLILEDLKSRECLAGNPKFGYWMTRKDFKPEPYRRRESERRQ